MPKKSNEAQVAESCIAALKDVISDLEKIAKGRGTEERFRCISELLFQTGEALRSIDPMWIRIREKEEAKARASRTIGGPSQATPRLLPGF